MGKPGHGMGGRLTKTQAQRGHSPHLESALHIYWLCSVVIWGLVGARHSETVGETPIFRGAAT